MTEIEKLEALFVETANKIERFRKRYGDRKDEMYWTTYANGIVACIALLRNDDSVGGQDTMDYLCKKYELFHETPHDETEDETTYPACLDDIYGGML